jgi:RNA polymerase sigma-70 factor (ECF subfamily)
MAENCLANGDGAADEQRRTANGDAGAMPSANRLQPANGLAAAGPSANHGLAVHVDRPMQGDAVPPNPAALPNPTDMPHLALERLVAEHGDALYRYAYRLTGAAADAEDLTQQTFLIAQRKVDQLRDERSARVWLMTVMRRTYCRAQIKNRPERERTVPLDVDDLPTDEVSDHFEIDRDLLQTAIDELPDEFKLVLLAFYFEQRSYREIAEQFELPMGTVMSRLARAKSHLRARLFEMELQATARRESSSLPPQGGR